MKEKKTHSLIQKMLAALIGGLFLGIACLFLREHLIAGGQENVWRIINNLLFQDITAKDGLHAIGIFYIIGKLFMNGLQLAIVPLVVVSLSLAMCSISDAGKLGRIAGKTLTSFFLFYAFGCAFAGSIAYFVRSLGLFSVTLPGEAATAVNTVDPYNPLVTIINALPNNIGSVTSVNTRVLAVVTVSVILGICINKLGEKATTLKKVIENLNDVIQMYLTFLINKVGPIAIFCMITRTFAAYGIEYLKPAITYVITTIIVLLVYVVIAYPLGVFLTTGLNPLTFLKKVAKVGVFGFSTNSSAATLPINTRTCEDELGCDPDVTSFVLPLGMTVNMNGTSMMHMVAVVYIATAAGLNITPATLVTMAILSICAAAGTPAIPVAGTTMIFTVLTGLGFNTELCMLGYALIVAINRPVEMTLLTLNVIGDAATNVIVCSKENRLNKEIFNR
ncbi:MAG: dicarboxylate/amino acid:cation symporter [Oscillospiraceae bacterium]|nr:dicarboxylate/amino acid:cation symporter [Oscillospiraceae bacterium]